MPDTSSTTTADPIETSRMSFGDHLEELRRRLILALVGLVITTILCFQFGDRIIGLLTAPYMAAMTNLDLDARMIQLNPAESFMEYFKISLKFGLVLSAPWLLYQAWAFVATGLYPHERKLLRLFAPGSIFLFLLGAGFMVVVALSPLMNFLIGVSTWFPMPSEDNWLFEFLVQKDALVAPTTEPTTPIEQLNIPIVAENPTEPADGDIWFNKSNKKLYVEANGERYEARMQRTAADQFVQPFFSIAEYLGFVTNLALAFGLGFQIPLVVIFLIRAGIIASKQMAAARKYVIFAIAILSAILTPSPDVGTMMMLAVPMVLLFEIGLAIGRMMERDMHSADTTSQNETNAPDSIE